MRRRVSDTDTFPLGKPVSFGPRRGRPSPCPVERGEHRTVKTDEARPVVHKMPESQPEIVSPSLSRPVDNLIDLAAYRRRREAKLAELDALAAELRVTLSYGEDQD